MRKSRSTHSPEYVVGIEMSDSHTTFSVVEALQQPRLVRVDRRVLPSSAVKDGAVIARAAVVEVLRPLFDELQDALPRARFAFSIPTAHISSHVFTFPGDFSSQEVDDALRAQADEYFPYTEEDCVIWWRVVQQTEQTQTIFSCATSRTFIQNWIGAFREAGIDISFIDIEPMNILRSVTTRLNKHQATMVLDIGRRMTYISAIDAQGIRDLAVLACPVKKTLHKENLNDKEIAQLLQSVIHETLKMQTTITDIHGLTVVKMIVCGFGGRDTRIVHMLAQQCYSGIEAYTHVNLPLSHELSRLFGEGLPFEYTNSTGVAMGVCLRPTFAPSIQ